MIRIPCSPDLATAIVHCARQNRERATPEYERLWEKELENASKRLPAADRIKLEVLHRQFGGRVVPGLPAAVATGRWLVRGYQKLRGRA